MCFSQEMSTGFTVLGILATLWVWTQTKNWKLTAGAFYFTLMEGLQVVQYSYINQCENPINKFLTVLGFLHICFQPLFTHLQTGAFVKGKYALVYTVIYRLCIIQGCYMFARWVLSDETSLVSSSCPNTEWLRAYEGGPGDLCTYSGVYHLAWSVPLTAPSYFLPGQFIHFFMMFAPFFAVPIPSLHIQGAILCLGGPILAAFITPNLHEQASIWCFFSILQVCLAVTVAKFTLPQDVWNGTRKVDDAPAVTGKAKKN